MHNFPGRFFKNASSGIFFLIYRINNYFNPSKSYLSPVIHFVCHRSVYYRDQLAVLLTETEKLHFTL